MYTFMVFLLLSVTWVTLAHWTICLFSRSNYPFRVPVSVNGTRDHQPWSLSVATFLSPSTPPLMTKSSCCSLHCLSPACLLPSIPSAADLAQATSILHWDHWNSLQKCVLTISFSPLGPQHPVCRDLTCGCDLQLLRLKPFSGPHCPGVRASLPAHHEAIVDLVTLFSPGSFLTYLIYIGYICSTIWNS